MSAEQSLEDSLRDVPSPIDLRDPGDAQAWADAARTRPGRRAIFAALAGQLAALTPERPAVLELGSGPGFLAEFLLGCVPQLRMTLLDFSAPMHALARARLRRGAAKIRYLERDFRDPDWHRGLHGFAAVITHQAVHELRHRRHAVGLHRQVANVLATGAPYLVCDHFYGSGGLNNRGLFMTAAEQAHALRQAGFDAVAVIERAGSLVLHRAVRAPAE